MKLQFYCNNKECEKENPERYKYEILIEAVMDENNIAHIFCPWCKRVLRQMQSI